MSTNRHRFIIVCIVCCAALSPLVSQEVPRDIFLRARSASRPSETIRLLEEALPASGSLRPWFLLELARTEGLSGNWKKSRSWSELQDTDSLPEEIRDHYMYWYGRALEEEGLPDRALILYKTRIDSKRASEPFAYTGYLRIASTGAEGVITALDAAFPLYRHSDPEGFINSRYLAGLSAVREGNWVFAESMFARFLELSATVPSDSWTSLRPWASWYRGWTLYRLNRYTEAIRAFSVYIDGWPGHERTWQAATASVLAAVQSSSDPFVHADRAIRLAPTAADRDESRLLKASLLIDRNRFDEASNLLLAVADGTGSSTPGAAAPRALFMLADISFRTNRLDEAESRWRRIIDRYPRDQLAEEAQYRIAEQWHVAGEWNRATSAYVRYRQVWPSGRFIDSALLSGADAWYRQGDRDMAILWWEEYVRRFPAASALSRAYSGLLSAYRDKSEWTAALRIAEAWKARLPREASYENIDDHIAELKLIRNGQNPDSAALRSAWNRAGKAATAEGRTAGLRLARSLLADFSTRSEAKSILEEVVARSPEVPDALPVQDRITRASALSLLANVARDDGDYEQSARYFLSAGRYFAGLDGERSAEALYGAADSFLLAGKRGDARQTAETIRATWKDSVWAKRAAIFLSGVQ